MDPEGRTERQEATELNCIFLVYARRVLHLRILHIYGHVSPTRVLGMLVSGGTLRHLGSGRGACATFSFTDILCISCGLYNNYYL